MVNKHKLSAKLETFENGFITTMTCFLIFRRNCQLAISSQNTATSNTMLKFKNQQVKCSTRYELIPDGGRYQWDRLFSEHHIPPRCATSVIIVDPHIYKDYHVCSLSYAYSYILFKNQRFIYHALAYIHMFISI